MLGLYALLAMANVFGCAIGYSGIVRLKRLALPPFGNEAYRPSAAFVQLIVSWDTLPGRIILMTGCVAVPLICGIIANAQQRVFVPTLMACLWTAFVFLSGLWICLYALLLHW